MNKISKVIGGVLMGLPVVALAQSNTFEGATGGITDLLSQIGFWINDYIIPLLIAIAVIVFFWGIIKYIGSQGDADKRTEARGLMIWGVVALFVMVSVWGLVGILKNTFSVNGGGTPTAPAVPYGGDNNNFRQ
jgi:heme A synthase